MVDLKLDAKTKALRDIIFGLSKSIHEKDVQIYQLNIKRQAKKKTNAQKGLNQSKENKGETFSQPQKPDVQISITSRGNMLVDQTPTEIKEDPNDERKTQMQPNLTPKLTQADPESDFELLPIMEPKYDFISQYIKQNEKDENLKVLLSNQDIQSQYSRS